MLGGADLTKLNRSQFGWDFGPKKLGSWPTKNRWGKAFHRKHGHEPRRFNGPQLQGDNDTGPQSAADQANASPNGLKSAGIGFSFGSLAPENPFEIQQPGDLSQIPRVNQLHAPESSTFCAYRRTFALALCRRDGKEKAFPIREAPSLPRERGRRRR